tara:strand:- start:412 stop:1083 length:672 start_codon:yes stop_codon:yes gene_type:complete
MKKFKSYLQERPNINIDSMVYASSMSEDHKDRISKNHDLFPSFSLETIPVDPPPMNSSEETTRELALLGERTLSATTGEMETFSVLDAHFTDEYMEVFDKLHIEYDPTELIEMTKQVGRIVLEVKYHFNRPRPFQLAGHHGIELSSAATESAQTPAYPSGHATQSMFLSLYYADRNPQHEDVIMSLANQVAESRIVSGLHYPTDNEAGREFARYLYTNEFVKE